MTTQLKKTEVGSYFIANYPPFSFWNASYLPDAKTALESPPKPDTPLAKMLAVRRNTRLQDLIFTEVL